MDQWTFYHYTSERGLQKAREVGISDGIIPWSCTPDRDNVKRTKLNMVRLHQWVTKNPSFIPMEAPGDVGPKNTTLLPNRRAEYRLTVRFRGADRGNVQPWMKFAKANLIPLRAEIESDLMNPNDWWVFAGVILPTWIIAVAPNPGLPRLTVDLGT